MNSESGVFCVVHVLEGVIHIPFLVKADVIVSQFIKKWSDAFPCIHKVLFEIIVR